MLASSTQQQQASNESHQAKSILNEFQEFWINNDLTTPLNIEKYHWKMYTFWVSDWDDIEKYRTFLYTFNIVPLSFLTISNRTVMSPDSRLSSVIQIVGSLDVIVFLSLDNNARRVLSSTKFQVCFRVLSTSIFNNQSRIFKFWIFEFFPFPFDSTWYSNSLEFKWNKFPLISYSEFQLTTTLFHYCVYYSSFVNFSKLNFLFSDTTLLLLVLKTLEDFFLFFLPPPTPLSKSKSKCLRRFCEWKITSMAWLEDIVSSHLKIIFQLLTKRKLFEKERNE